MVLPFVRIFSKSLGLRLLPHQKIVFLIQNLNCDMRYRSVNTLRFPRAHDEPPCPGKEAEAVPAESNGPQRSTAQRIRPILYQLRRLIATTLFDVRVTANAFGEVMIYTQPQFHNLQLQPFVKKMAHIHVDNEPPTSIYSLSAHFNST